MPEEKSIEPVPAATDFPEGLENYARTNSFTETTVPDALLNEHTTKKGSWGRIRVEEGTLRYHVTDPRRVPTVRDLTPENDPGVVEPEILHRVEPLGQVRFHVEFLRGPAKSIPLCKEEERAERENRARSSGD